MLFTVPTPPRDARRIKYSCSLQTKFKCGLRGSGAKGTGLAYATVCTVSAPHGQSLLNLGAPQAQTGNMCTLWTFPPDDTLDNELLVSQLQLGGSRPRSKRTPQPFHANEWTPSSACLFRGRPPSNIQPTSAQQRPAPTMAARPRQCSNSTVSGKPHVATSRMTK